MKGMRVSKIVLILLDTHNQAVFVQEENYAVSKQK